MKKIELKDQLSNKGLSLDIVPQGEMTQISETLLTHVAGGMSRDLEIDFNLSFDLSFDLSFSLSF